MLNLSLRFRGLLRDLLRRGQLRPVPSVTKCHDQLNGGRHLRYLRRDKPLLVGEQGGLRDYDVYIRVNAGLITAQFELQGGCCRIHSSFQFSDLLR